MSEIIKISEQIRDHLTKQRKQSKAKYGGSTTPSCAYRGDGGIMCAVGCLIKDEDYSANLESLCADVHEVVHAIQSSLGFELTEAAMELCMDWQAYHDDKHNGYSYNDWIERQLEDTSPEMFHIHMMGVHGHETASR